MAKFLVLLLPTLAAAAGNLKLTWKDCGDSSTHGHITSLSPATLTLGQKTTVTGSGSVDEGITAGTFSLKVTAGGVPLLSHSGDICKADTIKLPLGTGEIDWHGLACPNAKGAVSIPMDVTLSSSIPASLAHATIAMTAAATSGDKLLCLSLTTAPATEESLFEEFMNKFSRKYDASEQAQRFKIFVENLRSMEMMQMMDSSATYSHLSPFADLSPEEFAARNTLMAHTFDAAAAPQADLLTASATPDSWDWVAKGAVNAVKNQAQCGSCWAFATVANIEGVNFLKTKKLLSLSEQELVDCDKATGDQGCQGGLPANAYKDMIANKIGLELETAYPYTAKNDKCAAQKSKEQVFITGWKQISTDEDQIAAALVTYGPLSIGINATPMQFYTGGVANPLSILCNPKKLDHGVAIVGFGTDSGKKYWKIRNSWGASWGEKGYYRIVRGVGKCGLNTMVTTATMSSNLINV